MTKPRGRKRLGKKRIPLCERRDRYALAMLQADIDIGSQRGISERKICEAHAILRFTRPGPIDEVVAAMRAHKPAPGLIHRSIARRHEGQQGWLGRNDTRPLADRLRKQLHKYRKDPFVDADGRWLHHMATAWRFAVTGCKQAKDYAAWLADEVGEIEFFDAYLRPQFEDD